MAAATPRNHPTSKTRRHLPPQPPVSLLPPSFLSSTCHLPSGCALLCVSVPFYVCQMLAQDQKLTTSLPKLFEARRKRMMYLGFADDPVAFLNAIIASHVGVARGDRRCRVQASKHCWMCSAVYLWSQHHVQCSSYLVLCAFHRVAGASCVFSEACQLASAHLCMHSEVCMHR